MQLGWLGARVLVNVLLLGVVVLFALIFVGGNFELFTILFVAYLVAFFGWIAYAAGLGTTKQELIDELTDGEAEMSAHDLAQRSDRDDRNFVGRSQ